MLISEAQELVVVDPESFEKHQHDHGQEEQMSLVPLEVVDPFSHDHEDGLSITDGNDLEITLSDLPGAPEGTQDPVEEPKLEVSEKPENNDENDAKKSKKNEKWDWESKGPHGFVGWIKERFDAVPSHSGYDGSGLVRAISYLEHLDDQISKAMRSDLDGELDADKIEKVRAQIDDGLARLNSRLDKVNKNSKSRRKKKSSAEDRSNHEIIKKAQKITGVSGVFVTVPLLISGIGRVCINGMVSAGKSIEDIYADQVKKWGLNDREKAEVRWFLYDLGYQMRGDRGFMPDEDFDSASEENYDMMPNYLG